MNDTQPQHRYVLTAAEAATAAALLETKAIKRLLKREGTRVEFIFSSDGGIGCSARLTIRAADGETIEHDITDYGSW